MGRKANCWEVMRCGREPNGANVGSLGVCPAAQDMPADGLNGGRDGGRICWAVAGTFCGGTVQGQYAQKRASCMLCVFYKRVRQEEGDRFLILMPDQEYAPRKHTPAG